MNRRHSEVGPGRSPARVAALVVLSVLLGRTGGVAAQSADPDAWVVDPTGAVSAIERTPETIYLGGSFFNVGPPTGQGLPTRTTTGAPFEKYPRVAGTVSVVVADGERGWFIGGTFERVGGLARKNLAYVHADGRVSSWAPDPSGSVWALALDRGTLFVVGSFANIAGKPRSRAAAIDVASRRVLDWDPDVGGGPVLAVAVDCNRVYLGGSFSSIGGQTRYSLAAVDREAGGPTSWAPAGSGDLVFAIAVGGDAVYVGGRFPVMSGQLRSRLAAFDRSTNELLPWRWEIETIPECYDCGSGPFVRAMAVAGGRLYFGGAFTHVDSTARSGLAAIELETHALTAWDPQATGATPYYLYVYSMAVRGGVVYVGGNFDSLGGAAHAYAGAVGTALGRAMVWFPKPNADVYALAATDRAVYIGGDFTSAWSWQRRKNLAALDARTGALTNWDPEADGGVTAMKLCGKTLYVAGAFDTVGHEPREGIAALDATTGLATPWNPGVDAALSQPIWSMAMLHGTLFLGGNFFGVGGEARRNLAAVDSASGRVTRWNPGANNIVTGLAVQGDTLIIGGGFKTLGGLPRAGLAAVDTGGTVLTWRPRVDADVTSLLLTDGKLIASGVFAETLGVWRVRCAEFDPQSGTHKRWIAEVDRVLFTLAYANHVLYVGGFFTTIGGQVRNGLAALDLDTGKVLDWDPQKDAGAVNALQATNDAIYVGGGGFHRIGGDGRSGFAILTPAVPPPGGGPPLAGGHALALAQNAPNPAQGSTLVRFEMARAGPVSLGIYDLAGRCVARPLRGESRAAGPHEIELRTDGWPPGVYYVRMDGLGEHAGMRMVVIR